MSEALAILGYVVGIVGLLCAVGAIAMRVEWRMERDDEGDRR